MKRLITILIMMTALVAVPCFAFAENDEQEAPETITVATPTVTSVTTGEKKAEGTITVRWEQQECDGYEIQYATNSAMTSNVGIVEVAPDATVATIANLTPDKTYYVRMRAYVVTAKDEDAQLEDKAYSEWTAKTKIRTHVHEYVGKVTEHSTCQTKGKRVYTCECGSKYSRTLKLVDHKYEKKTTKHPTCLATGTNKYTCIWCDDKYYKTIAALGHLYKHTTIKKATCKHGGKYRYTCVRCDKTFVKKVKKREHYPQWHDGKYRCRDCKVRIKSLCKHQKRTLARNAAVRWAKKIAADNDFHYGETKWAHHNGCYYCGTNTGSDSLKVKDGAKNKEAEKTYCCNPFVTAAFCHGAKAPEVKCTVSSMRFGLANDPNKVLQTDAWKKISKPYKVTYLVKGDILLTPTHCMLYAGNGKVVHAAHHDNGVRGDYWNSSIVYEKIPDYQWNRITKIYRYMGTGKY